ncbi:FtsX-like permease family protein [candidate division KSB1 bacterium]|nr:FtsX-like permease family protein [candidate division KSB1 bacterium]NIT71348.1 FtsX-like permease family protein [candidate division KSB1 bacterium]NIU25028.1 FtsX-like permease family protein [candidate division KSB1 bacterium]NIU91062.1 FtsX-like permease family protein [candidate division KSB1 bacterium]NIW18885.1 FtsX-like permease family protein [candidate division KSB1 bacterium]
MGIDETENWRWRNQINFYTYLLLPADRSPGLLEQKIDEIYEVNTGDVLERSGWKIRTVLQPLASIHLHSNFEREIEPNGNATTVYILSTIAFFILLLACINFINLATARSFERFKEVGMRKVLGARRGNLIRQFLAESILIAFSGLLIALVLVDLLMPAFNRITGLRLTIDYTNDWGLLIGSVTLVLVVGLVGGLYPAFFLSRFEPIKAFKSPHKIGVLKLTQRSGLLVFQFVIAIVLIVGTGVLHQQLQFVKTKRLGFNKEQVVVLPLQGAELTQNYETFKDELRKHPHILSVSAGYAVPGAGAGQNTFRVEGVPKEARPSMKTLYVDHDYIKTLGIEIKAGRDFSRDFVTDATEGFILNEAAVNVLGWDDPIGKEFGWWNRDGRVVGVVENFHFASLYREIEPLVMLIFPDMFRQLAVRIQSQDVSATLAFLENIWQAYVPKRPFQYSFLEERFDRLYKAEQRFGQVWNLFTALAIFIACLGLLGLTALSTKQRTKEIAIRKVLGASAVGVVRLISKDFVRLVLVSIIVACPIAWYAMQRWLENFAYRVDISWWVFALAGGLSLVIAILTVSTQAIRAALANPVDSLRYE